MSSSGFWKRLIASNLEGGIATNKITILEAEAWKRKRHQYQPLPKPWLDTELAEPYHGRISLIFFSLVRLPMNITNPKFQLSSSNGLGDMNDFVS